MTTMFRNGVQLASAGAARTNSSSQTRSVTAERPSARISSPPSTIRRSRKGHVGHRLATEAS